LLKPHFDPRQPPVQFIVYAALLCWRQTRPRRRECETLTPSGRSRDRRFLGAQVNLADPPGTQARPTYLGLGRDIADLRADKKSMPRRA
jgi:hypothetical protein